MGKCRYVGGVLAWAGGSNVATRVFEAVRLNAASVQISYDDQPPFPVVGIRIVNGPHSVRVRILAPNGTQLAQRVFAPGVTATHAISNPAARVVVTADGGLETNFQLLVSEG